MATPIIYRVSNGAVIPSPGSGQFLGKVLVDGTLRPSPEDGLLQESFGSGLSAADDFLQGGKIPNIPSDLINGLGVVTQIDDVSKIAANLFASKSYEATIAAGEAVGGGGGTILGAIIASGPAAHFGATTPLGVLILGGFAAVGGFLGGEAGKALGGAKWIADNAPKLNNSDQFESSVRVDGVDYIAVLATDSNGGLRTFYYVNTGSVVAGQRYWPVTDLGRIDAIESRLLNDLGYDSTITQAQYLVQSGLSASGIPVGEVRYIEVGGQFSSPDGSSSQSVLQISTARDEVTKAPYEIRTPGRIVNGQFEASLGSVRIGMDSAGRTILFDDVAKSALGFSST